VVKRLTVYGCLDSIILLPLRVHIEYEKKCIERLMFLSFCC
jgi:hypothetical protein